MKNNQEKNLKKNQRKKKMTVTEMIEKLRLVEETGKGDLEVHSRTQKKASAGESMAGIQSAIATMKDMCGTRWMLMMHVCLKVKKLMMSLMS